MSIFSGHDLKAEIGKLALLPDKDYRDRSAETASRLGIDPEMLDVLYKAAREKHLAGMGAQSGSAFFGFSSIDAVRDELDAMKKNVANDLGYVREDRYLRAAAALEHHDPGEFERLTDNLKRRGLSRFDSWLSTVRKIGRPEAERVKQYRPLRKIKAGGGLSTRGQQGQQVDDKPLIVLPEIKPATTPVVDTPALFNNIKAFVRRFVVLTEHQLIAVVLWIAFTHAFDVAEVSPRLALLSPKKRCGKTTLQRVLALLSLRPLIASNISPSAIFRAVDELAHLTLLLDEVDTFAGRGTQKSERSEEIRGILNSGHTKDTAYVIRSEKVGDHWKARQFSTWAPICYAAIGRLSDTWEDRSIMMMMKRRLRTEQVEKMTRRKLKGIRIDAEVLQAQLARWSQDNAAALGQAEPSFPPGLNDRAEDNWDLLLAIADLVGPDWGGDARQAAKALSADRTDDAAQEGLDIRLLSDIKAVLEETDDITVGATGLCGALVALPEAPWSSLPRTGKPLTATRLALMLRPFEVYPKHTRTGNEYVCADLADALSRYLTTPAEADSSQPNDPLPEPALDPSTPESMSSSAPQPFTPSLCTRRVGRNDDLNPSQERPGEGLNGAQFALRRVHEVKGVKGQTGLNDKVAPDGDVSDGCGPSPEDQRKAEEEAELDRPAKTDKEEY